jgi:hypothetical protein
MARPRNNANAPRAASTGSGGPANDRFPDRRVPELTRAGAITPGAGAGVGAALAAALTSPRPTVSTRREAALAGLGAVSDNTSPTTTDAPSPATTRRTMRCDKGLRPPTELVMGAWSGRSVFELALGSFIHNRHHPRKARTAGWLAGER